jgi:hypothetical protein
MTFWGITTYFNPCGYKRRYRNYMAFRESSKKQGLKLVTVELALNNDKHRLTEDDADIMIHVKSNSVLWHKENLINIGLNYLLQNKVDCKYMCWLDCDLIFDNNNWIEETKKLLDKYSLVQPFEVVWDMDLTNKVLRKSSGYGRLCKRASSQKKQHKTKTSATWGFGWAVKTSFLQSTNGLYEHNVVGGYDSLMKFAFGLQELDNFMQSDRISEPHRDHLLSYINRCPKITVSDVHCTTGVIRHMWHGSKENRQYKSRHKMLFENNYDPNLHIIYNNYGCLEWSDRAPSKLKSQIEKYFSKRKEDELS